MEQYASMDKDGTAFAVDKKHAEELREKMEIARGVGLAIIECRIDK